MHGFGLYQQRIERIPVEVMSVGAIGGACVTLPLGEGSEWSCSWLARLEERRLCGAAELLPVSVEICLACARLGRTDALSRWLERFTDPSDPSALDPVQAALARFQMRRGELAVAEVHILLIQSPQLRDPLLLEFIDAAGSSDPCKASILLLLLEDPAARAEAAKKMVLRDEVSGNQTLLHRLIVALDCSPTALAALISNLSQQSAGGILQKISECLQADRKSLYAKIALDLEAKAAAFRSKI